MYIYSLQNTCSILKERLFYKEYSNYITVRQSDDIPHHDIFLVNKINKI